MRKLILSGLLLASVAAPVLAQDQQGGQRDGVYQGGHRDGDRQGGDQRNGDHRNGGQRDGGQRDGGYRGNDNRHDNGYRNDGGDHRDGGYRSDWRNDNRYRWEDYRRDNRQAFSLGRFYAPRGWAYRRFSIGVTIPGIFFGPRYWIRDPYAFRLPPAPYGAHWVRYYGDALLVQNRSGRVLDVVYGIFN